MIKVWDIHGGIHPAQNKSQSNQQAITVAGIPDQLVFPLSQHIGAPAAPIVEVGQRVLKGQMLAAAKGFVSVPIHASTSGEVIAIEQRLIPHPSGMNAPCIILKPDGKEQWIEHSGIADYTTIEKSELLNRIRESGIAGMGGAGFPSAVKLATRDDHTIETLIINGTECEPYITADDRLMRERADEIIAGAKILGHLINPQKQTLIGVEDNKPEGIKALQKAAQGTGIQIVPFPTKYPSGGEKQLIEILTGKQVPSGGLPADVGIVCQNIGTTVAIYRAVSLGEPLISRITTVTGYACKEQRNFEVLLGTPVKFLLNQCGFNEADCVRLIMGGPMMGFTLEDTDVPIVKTTNCLLAPTAEEIPPPPPAQACIRCGMCAEACPASLLPQQLYWFARGKEYDKLEAHNLMDCIECGACSYACPSNIPLVQYYRASKADIRQINQDHIKSEQSKLRFEARQQRLEREAEEKEAKRKARKEKAQAAANSDTGKLDIVQAAIERSKAKKEAKAADPAQAAIEKAMAKRAGGGADQAKDKPVLEQAVANAEKRLASATEKLTAAQREGADTVSAFETAVAKMTTKLEQARLELGSFSEPAIPANSSNDPAQAAIERAMLNRKAQDGLSEEDKLKQSISSLEKRLLKARDKLATAQASGDDNADIMSDAVNKIETKLVQAQAELADKA